MPGRPARILAAAIAAALSFLPACSPDQKYSQTQLNALQTREFDAGFDDTYDATIAALFDLGYIISHSDKRAGLITAGRVQSDIMSGHMHQGVQVKVDQAGPRLTSVRVSTAEQGQSRVRKAQIDQLLDHIGQRLTSDAPGA